MIGYRAWYLPKNGSPCPVLVVGEEKGLLVVWKLINGIVLERVVRGEDLYTSDYWEGNLKL